MSGRSGGIAMPRTASALAQSQTTAARRGPFADLAREPVPVLGDDELEQRPSDRGLRRDAEQSLGGGIPDGDPKAGVHGYDGCRSLADHIRRHDVLDDVHGAPGACLWTGHAIGGREVCQRASVTAR